MSLNEAANLKGYSVVRSQPGSVLVILNRHNGKQVSRHQTKEEVAEALALLPSVAPVKVDAVPVGWQTTFEQKPAEKRVCPNGGGPLCLCVSDGEWYFCAIRTCHQRAACGGACSDHYTQTKIIGDMTEIAIRHTSSHEDDGDLEALKKAPAKKISLKRDGATATHGQQPPTVPLPIGWNTRPAGEGFVVVDTLGNVMSSGNTAADAANNLYSEID